jgi:hypothetical protein
VEHLQGQLRQQDLPTAGIPASAPGAMGRFEVSIRLSHLPDASNLPPPAVLALIAAGQAPCLLSLCHVGFAPRFLLELATPCIPAQMPLSTPST